MTDDTRPVKPISRRLRFEILRRDNYTCRYCGAQAPEVPLAVDHVIPRVLGGSDDPSNLVTACRDCNNGKTSTSPDEHIVADVDAKALEWARAVERASEIRRAELERDDTDLRWFHDDWCEFFTTDSDLPIGWENSVTGFFTRGLDREDIARFVLSTVTGPAPARNAFRYFCGCCWRELSDRQEIARRLLEDPQ